METLSLNKFSLAGDNPSEGTCHHTCQGELNSRLILCFPLFGNEKRREHCDYILINRQSDVDGSRFRLPKWKNSAKSGIFQALKAVL